MPGSYEMAGFYEYVRHNSPIGDIFSVWHGELLYACGWNSQVAAHEKCSEVNISQKNSSQRFEAALDRFFQSGSFHWELTSLDWSGYSAFQRQVLEACAEIPSGETVSYGELARRVSRPGAARAVGAAMAKNRWPLLIPCHRVVGATGRLTGYSGRGGLATKQFLLDFEEQLKASNGSIQIGKLQTSFC